MSISKKNAEGYMDMTAYEALTAVVKSEKPANKRPFVYICSPFRGDADRNTDNALRYCRFALERGKLPIAPHCYLPRFMDDDVPSERELALSFGLRLLQYCREIWVFGAVISGGMRREIDAAKKQRIPIRFFTCFCEEVSRNE
jgi:hypothetical protein